MPTHADDIGDAQADDLTRRLLRAQGPIGDTNLNLTVPPTYATVIPKGPLGPPDSDAHHKFVDDCVMRMEFYRAQIIEIWQNALSLWQMYLNVRDEFRGPGEEWRSNIGVPEPFSAIEAKTAMLVSILTSSDPMIQPEAVDDSFLDASKSIERLLDYTYRRNNIVRTLTKLFRGRGVAGTVFYKLLWIERAIDINVSRDNKAVQSYNDYVQKLVQQNPGVAPSPMVPQMLGGLGPGAPPSPQVPPQYPDWMTNPQAFEQWRQTVNTSSMSKDKIPAPPLEGPHRIVRYRGPWFVELPLWAVFCDPMIDDMQNQNFVVHRSIKNQEWLEKRVKAGLYDEAAVALGMANWNGRLLEEQEASLAQMLGITATQAADPYYQNGIELLEVWQPEAEVPYAIILNRRAVINKDPYHMPLWHGDIGITALRSLVVPGHFFGLSDLWEPRDLFGELNKIHNLRLDRVTLDTLPAYTKLKEAGIPEAFLNKIKPGALIEVARPDAVNPLLRGEGNPDSYREPAELKQEIADATGIYPPQKGAPADIGRVTGTEFQGRANQAALRVKLDAMFTEEDMAPTNRQIIALWAQQGDDTLRVKIAGGPEPLVTLRREELIEGLEMDWRFRGATKAINRDMQVQQLLGWIREFGAQLTVQEFRYVAKRCLDLLDIRGADTMVSDAGTAQKLQEQQMAAQAQAAQQQAGTKTAKEQAVTPPQQVDERAAQALHQTGSGQGG